MGAFIARQPNGLLCRWSSIVDNITHYNMTEEDYIEYCAERAREEARDNLQNNRFVKPFSEILKKRDEDLVFQCIGVIENQQDYTQDEVDKAKNEMNRLKVEFDNRVKGMSEKCEGISMAKNKKQQGFEFIVKESDVLERENFGSFEIVVCRTGIMFKNYTGFHVFTTPYAVGLDGVAHETSLYAWLKYMVDFKKSINGKENEMFGETGSTNMEFLEGMKVVTEANLIKPMAVFTDIDEAQKEAENYLKWMERQMKDLDKAMNATPPEEDLKANAEFEHKAIMAEEAKEVFDGSIEAEKGQA